MVNCNKRSRTAIAVSCVLVVCAAVTSCTRTTRQMSGMLGMDSSSGYSWEGMPSLGGANYVTVERGAVSEGVSAYGVIASERQSALAFEVASGEVAECSVEMGSSVTGGQVVVALEQSDIESDLAEARADLLDAEDALADLEEGNTDPTVRLSLELQIDQMRARLDDAQASLRAFDAGADTIQSERESAAQDLSSAQAELQALLNSSDRRNQIEYLQWLYNEAEVKHGEMTAIASPSEADIDKEWLLRLEMLDRQESLDKARIQYQADVAAAEQAVSEASRRVAALDSQAALGADSVCRQQLVADIASVEADLAALLEDLQALDEGLNVLEIATAKAEVLKIEGEVASLERALADSVLYAPFDGIVTECDVVAGKTVQKGRTLVTIEDDASLYIVAQLAEADIERIEPGMDVLVSVDAYGGQNPIAGSIGQIPLYGIYEEGITTFEVPIHLEESDLDLMIGMSVSVSVPLSSRDDVLVVPTGCIYNDSTGSYVMLMDGEQGTKCYVDTGISDGIHTEIRNGLSEGQIVALPLVGAVGTTGSGSMMMSPQGSSMPQGVGR